MFSWILCNGCAFLHSPPTTDPAKYIDMLLNLPVYAAFTSVFNWLTNNRFPFSFSWIAFAIISIFYSCELLSLRYFFSISIWNNCWFHSILNFFLFLVFLSFWYMSFNFTFFFVSLNCNFSYWNLSIVIDFLFISNNGS